MRVSDWTRRLAGLPDLGPEISNLDASSEWHSVADEARPMLLAAAWQTRRRKMLVLAPTYERCLKWQTRLTLCGIPEAWIHQLPSGISALFEDAAPEHIALSDRIGALEALAQDEPCIVLATPAAALERTLPLEALREESTLIRIGDALDMDALERSLARLGYEYQEPVRLPGQFSRRGGILDIYATGRELPVRVELFGDEVESLRQFDPNSQRSVGSVPELSLAPSRETLYPEDPEAFREMLLQAVEREASMLGEEEGDRLRELVEGDARAIAERQFFDRLDLYRPLLHPESGCAADLLGEDGLLVLDEPLELEAGAARAEEDLAEALAARGARGEILHSTANDFMLPPEHFGGAPRVLAMTSWGGLPEWMPKGRRVEVNASSLDPYRGRADALAGSLKSWREAGFHLVFCTDQPTRAKAMLGQIEIFVDDAPPPPTEEPEADRRNARLRDEAPAEFALEPGSTLAHGNLGGGFALPDRKLAFVSDAELFGVSRLRLPQKRFLEGAPIATVLDLKPGDYVVHIQYGIGVFRGLAKRVVEGVEKEFLHIQYAPPDQLFVPTDQLDRVQKYLNPGDVEPKLNRLTGGEWNRTITKAKEDAKAFAEDLVKLYAQRKAVQRRPFGPDTPWQAEMEATFPWVETPGQMQAIHQTKRDLQEDHPMDRLVCGDVGFGKTEVAIRAAFKAVQSGKQVAVLCPTTILSEQHWRNFRERLEPFGVRIELLNRFRTAADRKRTLEGLKNGQVDLVLGTHALLGKEIAFKDLGLVIIDEEQKFGVKQKEVLKRLRTEVDVLSMSATPIPRTLSMALMDIRQMSLINDPPPGRLPIRTYVRPFSSEVVREALLRELARGGQVFYVYNRVQGIMHIAERLRKLVPHARIGVGHGQMTEAELEPVMLGFIHGEIDILLSTTIIENGIDIPNANTLIVENADRLGLSQLYQLRGRVGRSDRQAYAYFLYRTGKELTEGALGRLQALQEFSTLGSGYSLAFRDLQIRGAGELLGAKQHGAMASVGYELYTQLIAEAVGQMKNAVHVSRGESAVVQVEEPEREVPLPAFEVPVAALLPDTYIKDQAQRLYYYQQLMAAGTSAHLGEVEAEIEDRYGHPPEPVRNAFDIIDLRIRAREFGVSKLEAAGGRIAVWFSDRGKVPPMVFSAVQRRNRSSYLSRDSFVWPYTGEALDAVRKLVETFELELKEYAEIETAEA
jgi:transcription-repair coupling factor (superfamily II helicase)